MRGLAGKVALATGAGAVTAALAGFEAAAGRFDVLVNNTGWGRYGPFLDSDPELWDKIIAINLPGPINPHHAAAPGMVAFRASDDAGFITGQVISVSGGLTMHGRGRRAPHTRYSR